MLRALALLLATSFASADPGCAPPAASNSSNVALGVLLDLSTGGTLELHQQLFCAAQLAAQHATARNGSVVPELAALSEQLHVHAHPYDTLGPTAEQGFAASRAAIDAGVAALLGPLRSEVAAPVATAALGLPQLSPTASRDALSSKALYPGFSRTAPTDAQTSAALLDTFQANFWTWEQFSVLHVRAPAPPPLFLVRNLCAGAPGW